MIRLRRATPVVVLLVLALVVAACSSSGGGGITVKNAWARTSMAMAQAGAAYLVIENAGSTADVLIGGSTPVADMLQVHETVDMSSSTPSSTPSAMPSSMPSAAASMATGGSMLGMQQVERLEIPAGGSVELKPGSYHLMLIGLKQELTAGEQIQLTLTFEKAGDVTVTAEVRAN